MYAINAIIESISESLPHLWCSDTDAIIASIIGDACETKFVFFIVLLSWVYDTVWVILLYCYWIEIRNGCILMTNIDNLFGWYAHLKWLEGRQEWRLERPCWVLVFGLLESIHNFRPRNHPSKRNDSGISVPNWCTTLHLSMANPNIHFDPCILFDRLT